MLPNKQFQHCSEQTEWDQKNKKMLRGLHKPIHTVLLFPLHFMVVLSMLLELQCDRGGTYEIDSHLKAQWVVPGKLHTSLYLSTER